MISAFFWSNLILFCDNLLLFQHFITSMSEINLFFNHFVPIEMWCFRFKVRVWIRIRLGLGLEDVDCSHVPKININQMCVFKFELEFYICFTLASTVPKYDWSTAVLKGDFYTGTLLGRLHRHAWLQHSSFTPVRTSILLKVVIHVVRIW